MNITELINEIVSDWAYRVNDGMPDVKNPTHLKELRIVLKEMGISQIEDILIENLLTEKGKTPQNIAEEDKNFTNPILNKKVNYKSKSGEDKEGIVGNLLRQPEGSPARDAAEKMLPPEGSEERDALNKELGGEGQPKKPEDGEGGKAGGAEAEKEKQKQAASMFDPKSDPAMGARMDREKAANDKLAQKDKEASDKKDTLAKDEPNPLDSKFAPIDSKDVAKEMPQADPETFAGGSDIPDGVEPEQLKKFNTDIQNVAKQVADAKAKGEPAPNINLCDVTVPGTNLYCDDNLGIPRDEMPQFKGNASPGSRAAGMEADASGEVDTEPVFKEMLKEKGIKTLQTEVPADKLKATQKDLVGAKVVGMMGALEKDPNHPKITAPIYVSRDGYVIDGHHRWAAIVAHNAANPDKQIPMKTTVLDQDIKDAIPMANKFAEDMGIAAKKADANKEEPQKVTSAPKVTDKIKKKIENWTEKEKAFFEKNEGAPGSKERRSLGQALKDKAAGAWKAIKKGAKHEVEEFKAAGKGVQNFFSGKPISEHEQKALKAVAFKVVTTAVFGAAFGGLSHGVAAFGKHVAMEFIPHIIGETILKGVGKAAVFADMEGEAETDANMIKFTEMIAKGLEEMEISDEMMEQMVDSYNEKKGSDGKEMTEENLQLAHELMLEMIYGFINEATYPKADDGKFWVKNRKSGEVYKVTNPKEISHSVPTPGQIKKAVADDTAQSQKPAATPTGKKSAVTPNTTKKEPVAGADLFKDKDSKARLDKEKGVDTKKKGEDNTPQVDLKKVEKVTNELYGNDGKGPLIQNSPTSDSALKNGYTEGEWWVAPGNAGSNFNENMSNEAACILKKYPNLSEEELAMIIFRKVNGTKLGAQQANPAIKSKNKIQVPSGLSKEEAILYRNSVITARSGRAKYDRAVAGVDACKKQVGFGEIESVVGYGGTSKKSNTPEKIKTDRENMLAEVDSANNCYIYDDETGKVYKIEKENLKKWIKSSGGGENAADTVVLTKDKNGNLIYDGWSDKKTLADLQANGTLYNDMIQSGLRVEEMIKDGQISSADANKARKIIEDGANEIKLIERGYSTISSNHSKYHLGLSPQEFKKMEELVASNPDTKKHYKNWTDTVNKITDGKGVSDAKSVAIAEEISGKKRKKSKEEIAADKFIEDTLDKYGEDTAATLLKNPDIDENVKKEIKKADDVGKKGRKEYMNWFNNEWLTDKKNKTKIKSVNPFRLLNNVQIKSPSVVSENERKVIDRAAVAARDSYKSSGTKLPPTLNTQGTLEVMRKKAFETQRGIF
jgi:hypothetical protein